MCPSQVEHSVGYLTLIKYHWRQLGFNKNLLLLWELPPFERNTFSSHWDTSRKLGQTICCCLKLGGKLKIVFKLIGIFSDDVINTHDWIIRTNTELCCAYQICPGHLSIGQTLRTNQNVVLLFTDTHLKQNKWIKSKKIFITSMQLTFMYFRPSRSAFLSQLESWRQRRHRGQNLCIKKDFKHSFSGN